MRPSNQALEARLGPPDEHQVFAVYVEAAQGTRTWDLSAFQGWRLVQVLSQPDQEWATRVQVYRTMWGDFIVAIDAFPRQTPTREQGAALASRQPTLEAVEAWLETASRDPRVRAYDRAPLSAGVEQARRLMGEITDG